MNPHDPRAAIESEERRCRWCEEPFTVPEGGRALYCSDDCRAYAHALRERERRADLRGHGLCPGCKRPI